MQATIAKRSIGHARAPAARARSAAPVGVSHRFVAASGWRGIEVAAAKPILPARESC